MLIFGHVGISLAAGLALKKSLGEQGAGMESGGSVLAAERSRAAGVLRRMDLRILVVGSMLPDIIDKPVGNFFFASYFENGRIFAHTLLFLVLISVMGMLLYFKKDRIWLITLAFGSLLHLVEDGIWNMPRTLLWPFMGLAFDKYDYGNVLELWWNEFLHVPSVYIPEWIGAALLASFAVILIRRRGVGRFITAGRLI